MPNGKSDEFLMTRAELLRVLEEGLTFMANATVKRVSFDTNRTETVDLKTAAEEVRRLATDAIRIEEHYYSEYEIAIDEDGDEVYVVEAGDVVFSALREFHLVRSLIGGAALKNGRVKRLK